MSKSTRAIRVAPHVTESGKRGWRWTCSDHLRHRGHHRLNRWTDWVRANRNDPDDHAFVRCMRGASEHWHKLHAPEHHCCPIAYQEKAMTSKNDDEYVTVPAPPIEEPATPPPCPPNCPDCKAASDDVDSR
jgi:hypothetical protein